MFDFLIIDYLFWGENVLHVGKIGYIRFTLIF